MRANPLDSLLQHIIASNHPTWSPWALALMERGERAGNEQAETDKNDDREKKSQPRRRNAKRCPPRRAAFRGS